MRSILFLLFAVLFVLKLACSNAGEERLTLHIVNAVGSTATARVEVADSAAEREQGLTGRASLGADEGLLLDFGGRGRGLWMRDTALPLSAAFIDRCGEIVAVVELQPFSEEVHQPAADYRFALEMNQGWFQAKKIAAADRVQLPAELRAEDC